MTNDQIEPLKHSLEVLSQTHRFDHIIDIARQILTLDPQDEDAHLHLIRSLYYSHQYEEMLNALSIAQANWSHQPWFHYYMYLYYLYQGGALYLKAKEHIEEAIRLNPLVAKFHRERGEIYLINWEPEKAIDPIRTAVELDPDNPEYRSRLALALLKSKRIKESFEMAEKALQDGANDAHVFDSVGMIYTMAGELDKGEELFRNALRLVPTYDYFQKHIDWVLREKQDRESRQKQGKSYTPLNIRQKGTKRFFDEDSIKQ